MYIRAFKPMFSRFFNVLLRVADALDVALTMPDGFAMRIPSIEV